MRWVASRSTLRAVVEPGPVASAVRAWRWWRRLAVLAAVAAVALGVGMVALVVRGVAGWMPMDGLWWVATVVTSPAGIAAACLLCRRCARRARSVGESWVMAPGGELPVTVRDLARRGETDPAGSLLDEIDWPLV